MHLFWMDQILKEEESIPKRAPLIEEGCERDRRCPYPKYVQCQA